MTSLLNAIPAHAGVTRRSIAGVGWRECGMEAALLAAFMVSACCFGVLLGSPQSPVTAALPSPFIRRCLMGVAMALTAVSLFFSPWGRRSGAHINPAVTLCFLRLGRISPGQAAAYAVAQFVGGAAGVALAAWCFGMAIRHPSVNYVVTTPGHFGPGVAWAAEFAIALVMMITVLSVNRIPRLAPYTGLFAATLVALYITFEAPLSGMSLNPARTLASALSARLWTSLWVYLTAPPLGMLAAVEIQRLLSRRPHRLCGKWAHPTDDPSVFRCDCRRRRGI
jgi:aquaporin Z